MRSDRPFLEPFHTAVRWAALSAAEDVFATFKHMVIRLSSHSLLGAMRNKKSGVKAVLRNEDIHCRTTESARWWRRLSVCDSTFPLPTAPAGRGGATPLSNLQTLRTLGMVSPHHPADGYALMG